MWWGQFPLVGLGGRPPARLWAAWLADRATARRFRAKVYRRGPDECWPWVGAIGADGHGQFRAGSRRAGSSHVVTAHLYAYQLAYGLCADRLLTNGVVIRHSCDEAACQNPTHLAVGTPADNTADYQARRGRDGGPLADARGPAGRASAIRAAITAARPAGAAAVETAIAEARAAGDPHAGQPCLFHRSWIAAVVG